MGFFDAIKSGVSNAVDAAGGFVDGLTGASAAKKREAKRRQKAAETKRKAAEQRAESAQRQLAESKADATQRDRMQDTNISAASTLAARALQTARATAYESTQLQQLVGGIRSDLKALAGSAASAKALADTNEIVGNLSKAQEEAIKAQNEHNEGVNEAIAALNEEAADTTAHLDALTKRLDGKGQLMGLGMDLLPMMRTAISVLNVEVPNNKTAFYLYIAAPMFLKGRVDPDMAEIIITALQLWAYWDDDGISGLFQSRPDTKSTTGTGGIGTPPPTTLTDAQLAELAALQQFVTDFGAWINDPNVQSALVGQPAPPAVP